MTAIKGTYSNLKSIKTRKVWVLEIEFPEENIKHITDVLGFPDQSESKWVGVALLKPEVGISTPRDSETQESVTRIPATENNEEGEKLRIRACCLCKDLEFHKYVSLRIKRDVSETEATNWICQACNIGSRKELVTNEEAQRKFLVVVEWFNQWKTEQQYSDNLSR